MNTILNDVRYAFRGLIRRPGFAIVAILTLGIGIGINTSIFSVVNAVLLKPLPVRAPEELLNVYSREPGGFSEFMPLSIPDFLDLRERSGSFSDLIAYSYSLLVLEGEGDAQIIFGELVSDGYFSALGVPAVVGRTFEQGEDGLESARPVAVISHATWQQRFGGDPGVVGDTVRLNGLPFTVIGVASPMYRGMIRGFAPEVWIPMGMKQRIGAVATTSSGEAAGNPLEDRETLWAWTIGRLSPGVSPERAKQDLLAAATGLQAEFPVSNEDRTFATVPTSQVHIFPGVDTALYAASFVLMGFVGLVLLVAIANLSNLLLARVASRRKEISTRLALGVPRRRLIQQLLTESLILSLLGGGLGLLLALGCNLVLGSIELPLPFQLDLGLSVDLRVLLFTLAVSTLAAIIFGLVPAFAASRTDLVTSINAESRGSSGGSSRSRFRSAMTILQVAAAVLLLVCAGLSVRSLQNLGKMDPGFETDGVVIARFAPNLQGYGPERTGAFYRQLLERAARIPAVEAASIAHHVPLSAFEFSTIHAIPSQQAQGKPEDWPLVETTDVGPRYFETLRIPLIQGRDFNDLDTVGSPAVAIVNETLARDLWGGEAAVDRLLMAGEPAEAYRVVGVVKDSRYRTLGERPRPFFYRALFQQDVGAETVFLWTRDSPPAALAQLRELAKEIDERLAATGLSTLEEALRPSLLLPRTSATLFGIFGLVTLFLAGLGVYGVMTYSVSEKSHEIGIRMAMGAEKKDILWQVLRQGLVLAAIGAALGLVAAAFTTRVLSSLLYGISARDPLTFAAVLAFLLLVTLAASLVPARRAASLDPLAALRAD